MDVSKFKLAVVKEVRIPSDLPMYPGFRGIVLKHQYDDAEIGSREEALLDVCSFLSDLTKSYNLNRYRIRDSIRAHSDRGNTSIQIYDQDNRLVMSCFINLEKVVREDDQKSD